MKPVTPEAYKLLHEGLLALSKVEANGIRIDMGYLNATIEEVGSQIDDLTKELRGDKVYKQWQRRYGEKTNLGSRDQLAGLLFGQGGLGFATEKRTGFGERVAANKDVLSHIDLPFVQTYLKREKLKKAHGTYLKGIRRHADHGYLRPSFNLHTVVTYRSSANDPSFQNMPIRDPEIGKLIRSCFIPRKGNRLIEMDYSGIEVRVAACYHKDPTMLTYIKDPSKDMHRDMAAQCFKLKTDNVSKQTRYCGKNMFVFPQFYGDWYQNNAKALWEAITTLKLTTKDGKPMADHLRSVGIKSLGNCDPDQEPRPGTFEAHIKAVEHDFWARRFKVYAEWKKRWYNAYLKHGGFNTLTGFRIDGVFGRNDVINYPVQGSAFHCLLWSLTRLVNVTRKLKIRGKVVGQIHDSMLADVPNKEVEDYLTLAKDVMVNQLCEAWKWIIVPLDIEADVSPVNGSWFEKKGWELDG